MQESSARTKRLVSLAFILLIGVVFTLQFGPGSRGCDARLQEEQIASTAAKVNGREIPARDFARAYQNRVSQFQGQGLNADLLKQLGVPKQVLDQMVDTELLAQAAERQGIVASDQEIVKLIQDVPLFQKDGVFDPALYRQNVRGFIGKSDADFELELRRSLSAQKLVDVVANGALVSTDEVKARYQKEGNTANLSYVRFLPAMFAAQVPTPSAAELATFKAGRADEIQKQFEANKYLYNEPEKVRARQILIKLPEGATEAQKTAAKEKLAGIRAEAAAGKDFAALATEHSEDPGTKAQGGELGWVERGAFEQQLGDLVFGLQPGGMTEPVQTQFGLHLVKVEEKQPPKTKALAEVSDEIALTLYKKEKAQELAKAAAEKALAGVKAGQPLATQFAKAEGEEATPSFETETKPEARTSGSFSAAAVTVPGLGPAPELTKAAFSSKTPGPLGQVFTVGEAQVVAEVTERALPSDEDFAKKEAQLREEARQAKQYELRDALVKQLRAQG